MLIPIIAYIAFIIYAVVDCFKTPDENVKTFPKVVWVLIIVLVQFIVPIGAICWFMFGKERVSKPKRRNKRKVTGPDDDPDFLRGL